MIINLKEIMKKLETYNLKEILKIFYFLLILMKFILFFKKY